MNHKTRTNIWEQPWWNDLKCIDEKRRKRDLAGWLTVLVGLVSCVWLWGTGWSLIGLSIYYVGFFFRYSTLSGRGNPGWLYLVFAIFLVQFSILTFAHIYGEKGLIINGKFTLPEIGTSYYFSGITWTTIGYGDITPSVAARPFAVCEATFGYFAMSLIFIVFLRYFRIVEHLENQEEEVLEKIKDPN